MISVVFIVIVAIILLLLFFYATFSNFASQSDILYLSFIFIFTLAYLVCLLLLCPEKYDLFLTILYFVVLLLVAWFWLCDSRVQIIDLEIEGISDVDTCIRDNHKHGIYCD